MTKETSRSPIESVGRISGGVMRFGRLAELGTKPQAFENIRHASAREARILAERAVEDTITQRINDHMTPEDMIPTTKTLNERLI